MVVESGRDIDATARQVPILGAPRKTWEYRQKALALRDKFLRRFVLRGGVFHGPPEAEGADGQPVDNYKEVAKAFEMMQAGDLLCLDDEQDEKGNYKQNLKEMGGELRTAEPLTRLLEVMDDEQLLAFGIPPQAIQSEGVGSFALVAHHTQILLSAVEDIVAQFVVSFQQYVVDKVVEMNFDPDTAPRFRVEYTKLTDSPDTVATEVVKNWLTSPQASPLLTSGAVDVLGMLAAVGIPVSDDAEAALLRMTEAARAAASAAALPPAPPQPPAAVPDARTVVELRNAPLPAPIPPQNASDPVVVMLGIFDRVNAGTLPEATAVDMLVGLGQDREVAKAGVATSRLLAADLANNMPARPAPLRPRMKNVTAPLGNPSFPHGTR